MTSIRSFTMNDLFYMNNVNLDVLTETYNLPFYMSYMTYWPESFLIAKSTTSSSSLQETSVSSLRNPTDKNALNDTNQRFAGMTTNDTLPKPSHSLIQQQQQQQQHIIGYLLGKSEGIGFLWHGHVSAITISKYYRRMNIAAILMHQFEYNTSDVQKSNYFVDLFVRTSNTLAIQMYTKFGYRIYRRVIGYYLQSAVPTTSTTTTDTNNNTTTTTNIKDHHHTTGEDAYDMRKSLSRDPKQTSMIPLDHPIYPEDLEW